MTKSCGIDEAGRGPVIGPLVISGVVMQEGNLFQLEKLKVKDSKKHTPKEREELFEKIIAIVDDYEILVITPEQVDASLNDPGHNLNWLEADKSAEIIKKLDPEKAILDCPSTNPKKYKEYVKNKLDKKIELIVEHKADDNYIIVSAASILAKVTRDREIAKLRKEYGEFGSGYPSDPLTKDFLEKNHELPIYRKTWSSWRTVEENKNQTKLGDF